MTSLALAGAGCGGELAPVERAEEEKIRAPWILTLERGTTRAGTLRAHRVVDGQVRHELLDPAAVMPLYWAPAARSLAYVTGLGQDARLMVRRFDGERWYPPAAVTLPSGAPADGGLVQWSPRREQLLVRSSLRDAPELALAMPRADGSIATRAFDPSDLSSARWASSGDRVVVTRLTPSGRRATVYLVSEGTDLATTPHEIAPPPGFTFDDIDSGHDEMPMRDGEISPDGRWIVFVVRSGQDEATRALRAFSTSDGWPSRGLTGCPISRSAGAGVVCKPDGWAGSSTLLVRRFASDGGGLEAWTPAMNARADLGRVTRVSGRLGPGGTLLLVQEERSTALSIVDFADPSAPVTTPVPGTDQPSFSGVTFSPRGRWLLLGHSNRASDEGWIDALDLYAGPPWKTREILRGAKDAGRLGAHWAPGERSVLILPEQEREAPRGTLVRLATGATVPVEVSLQAADARAFFWQWGGRIGPDDRTLATARDGAMALWRTDLPEERAVKLEVPMTASLAWAPGPPSWAPAR